MMPRGEVPPPPIARLIGFDLTAILRPVWTGTLVAEGQVVKTGRTVGLVECTITDDRQRLIARASSTCMTLRGEAAAGR
jgi:uncharacterized protein (TIGR00369 family)